MTEAHQLIRTDWTQDEVKDLFEKSYLDLVFQAASVHRHFHDPADIQKCTLVSIKTGACPEDCSYCSQSSPIKPTLSASP